MSVSFTQDKSLSTICVYRPRVLRGKVIESTYTEGFHLLLGQEFLSEAHLGSRCAWVFSSRDQRNHSLISLCSGRWHLFCHLGSAVALGLLCPVCVSSTAALPQAGAVRAPSPVPSPWNRGTEGWRGTD